MPLWGGPLVSEDQRRCHRISVLAPKCCYGGSKTTNHSDTRMSSLLSSSFVHHYLWNEKKQSKKNHDHVMSTTQTMAHNYINTNYNNNSNNNNSNNNSSNNNNNNSNSSNNNYNNNILASWLLLTCFKDLVTASENCKRFLPSDGNRLHNTWCINNKRQVEYEFNGVPRKDIFNDNFKLMCLCIFAMKWRDNKSVFEGK